MDTSLQAAQGLATENLMQSKLNAQLSAMKSKVNSAATSDKTVLDKKAREAAESFEAMFISQMLQPMFAGIETSSEFGGGHGETMFRSMMVDEMGKGMARAGGIGLADSIYREILKMQEAG